VADFDKAILPGKEGKIEIKIYGHKLHATGRFSKSWTVTTNDPAQRKIILRAQGSVKKVFDISKNISMSGFSDEDLAFETILSNRLETPIHIKDFSWTEKPNNPNELPKVMGVKLETVEKGQKYRVKVWRKEKLDPGHYIGELVLATDFDKLPEKKLSVRVTVMPDVEVHPRAIIMREMVVPKGATKSFDRVFRVISSRGDSLKVFKAVPSSEEITVKITETTPGKAYRCTVKVRPPSQPGRYTGAVKLYTNYPGYEEINLPITGSVRIVDEVSAKK
jgi:hypothetical protein